MNDVPTGVYPQDLVQLEWVSPINRAHDADVITAILVPSHIFNHVSILGWASFLLK